MCVYVCFFKKNIKKIRRRRRREREKEILNASPMYIGSLGVEFYLVEAQESLLFHFKLTKVFLWPQRGKKL